MSESEKQEGFDREINSELIQHGNPLLFPDRVAETIEDRLAVIVTIQSQHGEYSVVNGVDEDQSVSSCILRAVAEVRDDSDELSDILSE
jgi:hypothetical protein